MLFDYVNILYQLGPARILDCLCQLGPACVLRPARILGSLCRLGPAFVCTWVCDQSYAHQWNCTVRQAKISLGMGGMRERRRQRVVESLGNVIKTTAAIT